jgi:catechol 2,3-dioxygenase-like lactoylglutathione lyase family enzyme
MAFERGRSKAEVIIPTSPKPIAPNPRPVNTGVTIGHLHLKVTDLNRAIAFYCGVLPCELLRGPDECCGWPAQRTELDGSTRFGAAARGPVLGHPVFALVFGTPLAFNPHDFCH